MHDDQPSPGVLPGADSAGRRAGNEFDLARDYRLLLGAVADIICSATPEGVIEYASPNVADVLGFSDRELLGRHFGELVHRKDLRLATEVFRRAVGAPDEIHAAQLRVGHRDGSHRWFEVRGRAVADDQGRVQRLVTVARDVTEERRRAEDHRLLATAVAEAAEAILVTDRRGAVEYVNPAFERITGYRAEEILGHNPRVLKSGKHPPEFYQELWATILDGRTWQGQFINRRKDGSLYHEQASIAPVHGARGEIVRFVAVKNDVTEQHRLEQQLQQASRLQAVGRLAGGIAHDFNNLLTTISGYSDLILTVLEPDHPCREDMLQIVKAADRASSLTRQLLAFSRQEVIDPRPVAPSVVIAELRPMLERLIGEDVELRVELDPDTGTVLADPSQLDQVVMNLAANARDAMPVGGTLTIAAGNVNLDAASADELDHLPPGDYVRVTVSDTGVGMSAEVRERIFEPFFTTKELHRGTGLGLATVYGVIKQNSGSVVCHSRLGEGASFVIHLPRLAVAAVSAAPPKPRAEPRSGHETILLVEDEAPVRRLVRRALERHGYRVEEAAGGEEAVRRVADEGLEFDLVVTDVVMPRLSGPEMVDLLRAGRPALKAVFMSGYAESAVVRRGVIPAGTAFLQKPFDSEELLAKVREVLDG